MLRSGNFWRTNRRPGNSMQGIISSEVWRRPEARSRWTRQLLFPLFFQHAEVFARRVQLKAEIRQGDFGKCQEGSLAKREGGRRSCDNASETSPKAPQPLGLRGIESRYRWRARRRIAHWQLPLSAIFQRLWPTDDRLGDRRNLARGCSGSPVPRLRATRSAHCPIQRRTSLPTK